MTEKKRVIKCRICGKPRLITEAQYAVLFENKYLEMCVECEKKAKAIKLEYPFVVKDEGLLREYINQIRGIDVGTE